MTPSEFLSYLYANSGHLFLEGTAVAMTIGAVGHALSALPWGWAKTAGGVLNGFYSDAFKILDTLKDAFAKKDASK